MQSLLGDMWEARRNRLLRRILSQRVLVAAFDKLPKLDVQNRRRRQSGDRPGGMVEKHPTNEKVAQDHVNLVWVAVGADVQMQSDLPNSVLARCRAPRSGQM